VNAAHFESEGAIDMRSNRLALLGLAVVLLISGCGSASSVITVTSVEVSNKSSSGSNPELSVIEASGNPASSAQSQADPVLPKQLKLDIQKIYLTVGQVCTIGSVVYPADALGKQLVWSSTDSGVASISEGVVRFERAGSAVITASSLLGDLTASCQVECITVCNTTEKLQFIIKNALLSHDSVFNTYISDPVLLADLSVDPTYGLFTADIKEKIYFVGDETMSEVYPVTFVLNPNFSQSCLKAIAAGNLAGLNELQSQTSSAAKKIVESHLSAGLSDYQKVKVIHDYIVKNGNLDTLQEDAVYSETVAYGVLVGNLAVSDGYTDAFQLLTGIAGIDSRVIVGTAGSRRRVWNLVKLSECWYHIDTVADDRADMTDGILNYDYFLISDARIAATHSWNRADSLSAPDDYIE